MATVPNLLLDGLTEGMILRTVEREPASPSFLFGEIERLLGAAPDREKVFPVIHDLETGDLIRPAEGTGQTGPKLYQLTQGGAQRLSAYRALPDAFKRSVASLFTLEPSHLALHDAAPTGPGTGRRADQARKARAPPSDAWVDPVLDLLPPAPPIQAPYAQVSLNRNPGSKSWTLHVEQHEPASYDGAQACPLTFLYGAATYLLYGSPDQAPQVSMAQR